MKEKDFISIIKTTLNSGYIGDDCAYLKDLGIVVSQDNLAEDVHFSLKYASPYQIGYKSVMVNISDICASGAEPKYLSIGLSLPEYIDADFIREFYKGAKTAAGKAEIVGGDITGADKIFVSVTAIGSANDRKISSRRNAAVGQKVVAAGNHGSSGAGLKLLSGMEYNNLTGEEKNELINAHLMPLAQLEFSNTIQKCARGKYAMMDTSDGLADALASIAFESSVLIEVDFDKIPHSKTLEKLPDFKDLVLYGAEDYGLVAAVDNPADFTVIGEVKSGAGLKINYGDCFEFLTIKDVEKNLFKHFKE